MSPAAGYSGTPLAKKLGVKPGHRLLVLGAPALGVEGHHRLAHALEHGLEAVALLGQGLHGDPVEIAPQLVAELPRRPVPQL